MDFQSIEEYNRIKVNYEKHIVDVTRQLSKYVLIRVVLAILLILTIYFAVEINAKFGYLIIVILASFFVVVKKHGTAKALKDFYKSVLLCINEEFSVDQGAWKDESSSSEFKDPEHNYCDDLDLFGRGSFFEWFNRAESIGGRSVVKSKLKSLREDADDPIQYHKAIEEVSLHPEWRLRLRASGKLVEEQEKDLIEVNEWMHLNDAWTSKPHIPVLLTLVPVYFIVNIVLGVLGLIPGNTAFILACLPLILVGLYIKRIKSMYDELNDIYKYIAKYRRVFEVCVEQPFKASHLNSAVECLKSGGKAMSELDAITSTFDQRNNFVAAILTNMIYLADIRTARKLNKWRLKYGSQFAVWLKTYGELEFFSSGGSLRMNHNSATIYPKISESKAFSACDLIHPQMVTLKPVPNNVELKRFPNFLIVTGANMAGKSTYLRTVGVNLVLAHIGLPVFAKDFEFYPTNLITSMRTQDSLKDGTSYFLSELQRLEKVKNEIIKGKPIFILLDEILKGTNSKDKASGSAGFIRMIVKHKPAGIIATHDLSLCEIASEFPDIIENHKFDAEISADDLSFDYKMKEGICENMNASYLMKKMGIIE